MSWTDDFNRADGPLGAPWSVIAGSLTISGNKAVGGATLAQAVVPGTASNQSVTAVLLGTGGTYSRTAGVILKGSGTASQGYTCLVRNLGFAHNIQVFTADSYTGAAIINQQFAGAMPNPTTMVASWADGTLTVTLNGTDTASVADDTYEGNTDVGIEGQGAGAYVDSFTTDAYTARSMEVTPDPTYVGAGDVGMLATGTGTAWTPGVPGSSTLTVDHGTITSQWTEDGTHIHFTLEPAEYVGTLTFTEDEYGLTDTTTATLTPPGGGGSGECPFNEAFVDMANDTGSTYQPGHLLTDSHVVVISPLLNIQDSLSYLITLVRNLYNPTPDWPSGEPAPDVRLDQIWDWVSGGAAAPGLPQTPTTSTPLKTDTERIYAFLKGGVNDYADLSAIVELLGGAPTVYSHADLKAQIDLLDTSAILTRLTEIQGGSLVTITDLAGLINNLTSGGTYDLASVLTAISNLNPSTAPGLAAATASVLAAIAALAVEVAAVGAAETEDAAASSAAAIGIGGVAVEIGGIITSIAQILSDLAQIKAGLGSETYHPPVWPGLAHVVMGSPQDLQSGLVVAGPMHGVRVHITSCDPGTSFYDYDTVRNWRNAGALSFCSDVGDQEQFQPLGWQNGVYVPLHMTEAASCKLHLGRGPQGTITPWSYAT